MKRERENEKSVEREREETMCSFKDCLLFEREGRKRRGERRERRERKEKK